MCFSATASFTASATLSLLGVLNLTQIPSRRELLLASFPLLFAIQQFSEGMVWLTLSHPTLNSLNFIFINGYLLFATGLWPLLCPLSVYFLEDNPKVRKILGILVLIGCFQGVYLFSSVLVSGVSPVSFHGNLLYDLNFIPFYEAHKYLYLFITSLSFAIASKKLLKIFGVLAIVFFVIAQLFYKMTFVSVWCFFAAILSGGIYLILSDIKGNFKQITEE